MANLLRRGLTWYARYNVPQDRWADVGAAMGASGGEKREVVRTLRTTDFREAERRRDDGIAAIRRDINEALQMAGKRPLSDWTPNWMPRAVERRRELQEGRNVVLRVEHDPRGNLPPAEHTLRDELLDHVRDEAALVARRQSPEAARRYTEIATGDGLSVAEASRQWLDDVRGTVRPQTWKGHRAALDLFGSYLATQPGAPTMEGAALSDVTRRLAGEFIAHRRATRSAATVQREFSTYSGLWRWAVRRGYAETNPWHDQTAGLKQGRNATQGTTEKTGYSDTDLVKLIVADNEKLAPGGGGYGPIFWDMIRLALLTGARADELLSLRLCDVIEDGTAIATPQGGKTKNAARIIPLHAIAQRVVQERIASLGEQPPEAPLWPEVPLSPAEGARRSKTVATRFVAVRRRILGDSDAVDLHSFRRSFATAAETALHYRGRLTRELVALLMGHARGGLGFDLYSDWTRLGRRAIDGELAGKLATLRDAVDDVVALGLSEPVRKALEDTAGQRPPVVRTAPAFRRTTTGSTDPEARARQHPRAIR